MCLLRLMQTMLGGGGGLMSTTNCPGVHTYIVDLDNDMSGACGGCVC